MHRLPGHVFGSERQPARLHLALDGADHGLAIFRRHPAKGSEQALEQAIAAQLLGELDGAVEHLEQAREYTRLVRRSAAHPAAHLAPSPRRLSRRSVRSFGAGLLDVPMVRNVRRIFAILPGAILLGAPLATPFARAETIVVGPADGSCPGAIFSRIQNAL